MHQRNERSTAPVDERMADSPSRRSRTKPRHAGGLGRKSLGAIAIVGLLASGAGAVGAIATTAAPASATSVGPGLNNNFGGHMGTQPQDGVLGICMDPSLEAPLGLSPVSTDVETDLPAVPGSREVTGDDLGRVNMALTKFTNGDYGDPNDPTVAAAVNGVVYEYSSAGTPGAAYLTGEAAPALDLYNSILADVQTNFVAGSTGAGSGSVTFNVDPTNNFAGTATFHMTPGSTGTATLTNGVFTATGTTTRSRRPTYHPPRSSSSPN